MASLPKIILCTGANQGLGKAVVQAAATIDSEATYIMCSRDLVRGKDAAAALKEAGIKAKLDVIHLDVTNDDQIAAAVQYVTETYGRLDVLINNAGIIRMPSGDLSNQRALYNEVYNTNLTSVGIITDAFKPLLYQSSNPRVISISSGLGSIQGALTKKMYRAPCYGSSKIGMNGLMVHMQVSENDRKENSQKSMASEEDVKPVIRFFCCAPGPLSTAFTGFHPMARPVETGTQVVVRLIFDDERKYEGGTYWEFEENEMRQVPW